MLMGLFLVAAAVIGILRFKKILQQQKNYRKYISVPGPYTGKEAAYIMMKRNGYDAKFAIPNIKSNDPLEGNAYLPDQGVFLMRREIMDGKTILSTCIGCQLAESAMRYLNGDLCKEIATSIDGNYAIKYDYNEEELETLLQKVQLINAAGGNSTEQGYN